MTLMDYFEAYNFHQEALDILCAKSKNKYRHNRLEERIKPRESCSMENL